MSTVSINKNKRKTNYINFRMRKLIYNFILESSVQMYSMTLEEKSRFISEKIESLVCENYWIKDKKKDISYVSINKKIA